MPVGPRPDPPLSTARVAIQGTVYESQFVNTFHLLLTHDGAGAYADFFNMLSDCANVFANSFAAIQRADVHYFAAHGTWHLGTGDIVAVVPLDIVGGEAGDSVADVSACMVVDWIIAASYRGGHPRNYIPGIGDSEVIEGSRLTAGKASSLVTQAGSVLETINGLAAEGGISAVEMGCVSFQTDKEWRDPPVFRPYIAATTTPYLGSQRRRIRN